MWINLVDINPNITANSMTNGTTERLNAIPYFAYHLPILLEFLPFLSLILIKPNSVSVYSGGLIHSLYFFGIRHKRCNVYQFFAYPFLFLWWFLHIWIGFKDIIKFANVKFFIEGSFSDIHCIIHIHKIFFPVNINIRLRLKSFFIQVVNEKGKKIMKQKLMGPTLLLSYDNIVLMLGF